MSSSEWNKIKLGKLVEINARSITSSFAFDEIEYIDTSSVTNNRFEPFQKLKLHEAPSRAKRIVRDGDIILSTVRPIQRHFGFIRNPKPNTIASTGFAVLTPKKIYPEFLYYYLSQDSITYYLNGIAETTTTTFPAFRPDTLEDLEIEIPNDIQAQRRIADILSALDEKIELNRQVNATLESMAQVIFREWFVENEEAKNWELGKLGDFGNIVCGKTPSKAKSNYFGGEIPFIKIPDMHHSIFITQTEDSLTQEGAESQKNKFLPPYSIIVSCIATVGLVAITSEQSQTNQQINAIIPRNKFSAFYLYFCAKELEGILKELGSGGSATLNVNTTSFSRIDCLIPPNEILMKFDEVVRPLFDKILTNQQQTATLASIRDALLPKLMSGEIISDEVH